MKRKKIFARVLIATIIGFVLFFLIRGPTFSSSYEVQNISHLIQNNVKKNYSGALLVNLDEDSEKEIFISVVSGSNIFYKWINGSLQNIKIPELEEVNGKTFSVTACDVNNDGRDELLIINKGSDDSKLVTYKNGRWGTIGLDKKILQNLSRSYSAACIDRNGDHVYGLAVSSENGAIQYLEMRNSQITDIASEIGLNLSSEGRSVIGIPGPTGYTNIFVGNKNGSNFYFVNNLNGTFHEDAKGNGLPDKDFEARGASLIDINHDEIIDLIYGNHLGPVRFMKQERTGKFSDVTPQAIVDNYAVNAVVVGDFNLDGYEDIYLNDIRHKNNLFARVRDDWFEIDLGKNSESDMFGVSSVAGDFDNDGKYDLLNTHGDSKEFPLTLYTFKPHGKYIKFQVKLPDGGIPRGAIVKLRTSLRDQVKAFDSGSGRFANYDDILTFGLLKEENIVSAEVILPSGKKLIKNTNFKLNELNMISL